MKTSGEDINVFKETKTTYDVNGTFKVHNMYGTEYRMFIDENLTEHFHRYETITEEKIGNTWIKIVSEDDGDIFACCEYIFLPENFTGEAIWNVYQFMKFDSPRVLSSINPELFRKRFERGKNGTNLTPLQEMMYYDILEIILRDGFKENGWNLTEIILGNTVVVNDTTNEINDYIEKTMSEAMKYFINPTLNNKLCIESCNDSELYKVYYK